MRPDVSVARFIRQAAVLSCCLPDGAFDGRCCDLGTVISSHQTQVFAFFAKRNTQTPAE
jgi:hypothetical protein